MRSRLPILALLATLLAGCAGPSANDEESSQPEVSPSSVDWPPKRPNEPRNLTPADGETESIVLKGATVMTAAGDIYESGYVHFAEGEIREVSKEPIDAPNDAEVVDASGKFVTPGIIDTHSHMGNYSMPSVGAHSDGNEATDPTTPGVDAAHGVWPQDPAFQRAVAGGVTAVQVLPGSANLMGGRTVPLEMHPGISAQAMVFEGAPDGLKMACGENPKGVYGGRNQMPSTRMGNAYRFRQAFQSAVEKKRAYATYRRKVAEWREKPESDRGPKPTPPSRDFGLENLIRMMEGDLLLHVHCYRADDMVKFLEIADEFDFEVRSFHHGLEAYKIRDILAKWDISVSTWADWWGFKMEAYDAIPQNAGLVEVAGGRAVIHSDSSYGVQHLNQEAAKAYHAAKRKGLEISVDDALQWITANAAWTLGIDDVTGTLEEGKRADVVVWSDHPFSSYAEAETVWVEGVREYDRSENPRPWSDFEVGQSPREREVTP